MSETERTTRVSRDLRNDPGTDLEQSLGNDSGTVLGHVRSRVPQPAQDYFTHRVRLAYYGSSAITMQVFDAQPIFLNSRY